MEIEMRPLAEIKPYDRNPRHNDAAVDGVLQSIENYGFCVPIVLDKDKTIIEGHTRYKALQKLGWKDVPCVILHDLSEDKVRELRIVDNKTAEVATWNWDHLMPELRGIADLDSMQVFFPDMDLSVFLSEEGDAGLAQDGAGESGDEGGGVGTVAVSGNAIDHGAQVEVTCPHCGGDFSLSKEEFERRAAYAKGKDGGGDGAKDS